MKVTLTRVARADKDIKGKLVPTIGIQTKEHGEKWLNSFKLAGTEKWSEGQSVDIVVTEKEVNGKIYLNFTLQEPIDPRIEARLQKLEKAVFKSDLDSAIDDAYTDFQEPAF
jgi:hypothetical protein